MLILYFSFDKDLGVDHKHITNNFQEFQNLISLKLGQTTCNKHHGHEFVISKKKLKMFTVRLASTMEEMPKGKFVNPLVFYNLFQFVLFLEVHSHMFSRFRVHGYDMRVIFQLL